MTATSALGLASSLIESRLFSIVSCGRNLFRIRRFKLRTLLPPKQTTNLLNMKQFAMIAWSILGFIGLTQAQDCDVNVEALLTPGSWPTEVSWTLSDASGVIIAEGSNPNGVDIISTFCISSTECYTLELMDSFGDGWNGATLSFNSEDWGWMSPDYSIVNGSFAIFTIGLAECADAAIAGCMDPTAMNYNPFATEDDGSCEYFTQLGCTDPAASNYNPYATEDDGSCQYPCGEDLTTGLLYLCTFQQGANVALSIVHDETGEVVYAQDGYANFAIEYLDICLTDGCYTATLTNLAGETGWYNGYFYINSNGAQVIYASLSDDASEMTLSFSIDGSCGDVLGCTDPEAPNFNPDATVDDGSCLPPCNCEDEAYEPVCGYDPVNWVMTTYNNLCEAECAGAWVQYDGTCEDPIIGGCTDPSANNYNPQATVDDGSCTYPCGEGVADALLYVCTFAQGANVGLTITNNETGEVVYDQAGYNNYAIEYLDLCLEDGCYTAVLTNLAGETGWYNGYFYINSGGAQLVYATLGADATALTLQFSTDGSCGDVLGCTDPEAANYNPDATVDDGSCLPPCDCEDEAYDPVCAYDPLTWEMTTYDNLCEAECAGAWVQYEGECGEQPIYGCTDPGAANYNPDATEDDGSCVYPIICNDDEMLLYAVILPGAFLSEMSYAIMNSDGEPVLEGYGSDEMMYAEACVAEGCYDFWAFDSWGDGWNNGAVMVSWESGSQMFTLDNGSEAVYDLNLGGDCGDGADGGDWEFGGSPFVWPDPIALVAYPNPTENVFNVDGSGFNELEIIVGRIMDMSGKVVRENTMNHVGGTLSIDVKGLASGLYSFELRQGNQVGRGQISVMR